MSETPAVETIPTDVPDFLQEAPEPDLDFPVDDQPAQPEAPPAPKGRESMFEINGKQYQITEEQLLKYYGFPADTKLTDVEYKTVLSSYKQGIQFNNKNREASQMKKQVEEAFRKLWEQPKETLKELAKHDPQRFKKEIEAYLLEELEEEMLDPTEKELRQYKRQIEEITKQQEMEKQLREQQELEAAEEYYAQTIENEIMDVLQTEDLPKTQASVRRIAFYLHKAAQKGYDLKAKDVVPLVKEDIQNELGSMLGSATPEQLEKLLGADQIKKIRQAEIQKVKTQASQQRSVASGNAEPYKPQTKKVMSTDEFRELAQKRIASLK